jgi:hypothetical protein
MENDADKLRRELGLGPRPEFLNSPPPRPVDRAQVRALHEGNLDPETADEVEDLIVCFREWHDADRQILLERVEEARKELAGGEIDEQPEGKLATYLDWERERLLAELADHAAVADVRHSDPLAPYRGELRRLLCDEWRWSERRLDPDLQDPRTLAQAICQLLSTQKDVIPLPEALVAAVLVKEGLDSLCKQKRGKR